MENQIKDRLRDLAPKLREANLPVDQALFVELTMLLVGEAVIEMVDLTPTPDRLNLDEPIN